MTHAVESPRDDEVNLASPGPVVLGPQAPGLLRRLAHLARCRKGAASLIFAASSLAFLGLVGLATEAGSWYMANRRAQNAADAAAVAGAMTYGNTTIAAANLVSASTRSAGLDTASRNGFAVGGSIAVAVNRPPSMGPNSGNTSAVEVIIRQTQAISFARLFNINATTISNRAVAVVSDSGTACVLSLEDTLVLGGSITITAPNCVLASNKTGQGSIDVNGGPSVDAQYLTGVGSCTQCSTLTVPGSSPVQYVPYREYQLPTQNPFIALDTQVWPSPSCDNRNYGTGNSTSATSFSMAPTYGPTASVPTNKAYCGRWHFGNNDNVVLTPGTYLFYGNADISITGGTVSCPTCDSGNGVHIVMIPDNAGRVGDLNINGGTVTLTASPTAYGPVGSDDFIIPGSSPAASSLAGVLFYRKDYGHVGGPNEVTINGNTGTSLIGGMYFPGADASYNGSGASACTLIVGGAIRMNGNATLDYTGCTSVGTPTTRRQIVKLVE